jgi:hypothetical protein
MSGQNQGETCQVGEHDNDGDKLLTGAEEIGRDLGFLYPDGSVNLKKTYHLLEKGFISASKLGGIWVSTRRRARRVHTGEAVA